MELNTQFFEVADLISLIKKGKLVLPEFQREFEWKPDAIADLLRTVVRRWPCGTLLFLKSDGELVLAPRAVEYAPDPVAPTYYVLDGQQRLTSLYHAFDEQGSEIYYIQLGKVREVGSFEDEHLVYVKKDRFHKRYPTLDKKVEERVLEASAIRDEVKFGDWCDRLPQNERSEYRQLRSGVLSGLVTYRLPALVLDKDVPLQAIAKIFETINKTGVQLGFLDLMVAKLYPLQFRLRERIEQAKVDYPILGDFACTGEEIIQIIALRQHFSQSMERAARVSNGQKNVPPVKVKGIRKGDMLSLDGSIIVSEWDKTAAHYARALEFIRNRCGVIGPKFLPSEAMLIPLAMALADGSPRAGFEKDLERWFWCSTFAQTYAQGANTQAVKDARELRAWRELASSVPDSVRSGPELILEGDLLLESRKRNEMALRGIMSLLALRDARDWASGKLIREHDPKKVEMHHIFPESYLKNLKVGVLDKLVNFTPLSEETNAKLRDMPPSEVVKRVDIQPHLLQAHCVPAARYETNDYANFDGERQKLLRTLIKSVVS